MHGENTASLTHLFSICLVSSLPAYGYDGPLVYMHEFVALLEFLSLVTGSLPFAKRAKVHFS